MNDKIQTVVVISFLLAVVLCYARDEEGKVMPREKIVEKQGVSLRVSLPEKCVAGNAILCEVSLVNTGKEEVEYEHISDYKDFALEVRDASGAVMPLTRFGKAVLWDNEGERKKSNRRKLLTGKKLVRQYNLSRLFDVTMTGDYTITVTREHRVGQGIQASVLKIDRMQFSVSD